MTAQTFPPRTLNPRKLARLADEPTPMPVAALPGHCACGHKLSVANTSGVCDSCADEKAQAKRCALRLPGQMCHCGRGLVTYRHCCVWCNREYSARSKARKREARRMEW